MVYTRQSLTWNLKMMISKFGISFFRGWFPGSMLNPTLKVHKGPLRHRWWRPATNSSSCWNGSNLSTSWHLYGMIFFPQKNTRNNARISLCNIKSLRICISCIKLAKFVNNISGWWFQPIWNICSSKWESSPIFGVKIKNMWVATTQIYRFTIRHVLQHQAFTQTKTDRLKNSPSIDRAHSAFLGSLKKSSSNCLPRWWNVQEPPHLFVRIRKIMTPQNGTYCWWKKFG